MIGQHPSKRGRGRLLPALLGLGVAILLAFGPTLSGLHRSRDSFEVAERVCAHLVTPEGAESPERHQCLQNEGTKPDFRLVEYLPTILALGVVMCACCRSRRC